MTSGDSEYEYEYDNVCDTCGRLVRLENGQRCTRCQEGSMITNDDEDMCAVCGRVVTRGDAGHTKPCERLQRDKNRLDAIHDMFDARFLELVERMVSAGPNPRLSASEFHEVHASIMAIAVVLHGRERQEGPRR